MEYLSTGASALQAFNGGGASSSGGNNGGLNLVSAGVNLASGNWVGLAMDGVNALKSSDADNTKAGLQCEARIVEYKNEKAVFDNIESLDHELEARNELRIKQLKMEKQQEIEKIKANSERKSQEITEKREKHKETLVKMQDDLSRRHDNQKMDRMNRFSETLATHRQCVDEDYEWFRKEISENKKLLHMAYSQYLDQRKNQGKENEQLKEELIKSELARMDAQFNNVFQVTVKKLNEEYELEKSSNEQKEAAFRKELDLIRKLGIQRIGQLGMMLDEQAQKIESEKRGLLKNELLKINHLRVSIQQSKDACVNVCFGAKRPEKITNEMRQNMEILRNMLYGLSSQVVGVERRMAEVEECEELETQIGELKQSNTKTTEAITEYLCHHKLSGKKAELVKTNFVNSVGDLLKSMDSLTIPNSGCLQTRQFELVAA